MRSDSAGGERLNGDLARVVVAAHLELVEHSGASEQIEADAEPLGETNRDGDPDIGDLVGKIHLVHNRFTPPSTALKLGNTKSLAVRASTVIRLQLFDRSESMKPIVLGLFVGFTLQAPFGFIAAQQPAGKIPRIGYRLGSWRCQ